ncbi:unnamed protein product [Rotaria socialis]
MIAICKHSYFMDVRIESYTPTIYCDFIKLYNLHFLLKIFARYLSNTSILIWFRTLSSSLLLSLCDLRVCVS